MLAAGCADDASQGDDATHDVKHADDNATGNMTMEVGSNATINHPPEAGLRIDVPGPAGNHTQFNITVSDRDGDDLTWRLDADGDGQSEANGTRSGLVAILFEVDGNYTATLTVSDGNTSANATLGFTVDAAVQEGPCGAEPEPCMVSENDHVEFWSDGVCQAKDEIGDDMFGWIRQEPFMGVPGGTSLWIYEETNGLDGLQVHSTEGGAYAECVNGDTIIF